MTRAGRIYNILTRTHDFKKGTIASAWLDIFDTTDMYTVFFMLERLHDEIKLLEKDFEDAEYPAYAYKHIIEQSEKTTTYYNFHAGANSFATWLPLTTLSGLHAFSFSFGENEKEIDLNIAEDILTMYEVLGDIEDGELKKLLLSIIQILQNSSTIVDINGAKGLHEMFKTLYCKVNTNLDDVEKAPKKYMESLISAYTKVKRVLNESQYALNAPDKLIAILEKMG